MFHKPHFQLSHAKDSIASKTFCWIIQQGIRDWDGKCKCTWFDDKEIVLVWLFTFECIDYVISMSPWCLYIGIYRIYTYRVVHNSAMYVLWPVITGDKSPRAHTPTCAHARLRAHKHAHAHIHTHTETYQSAMQILVCSFFVFRCPCYHRENLQSLRCSAT